MKTPPSSIITVVIVEDHQFTATGLSDYFSSQENVQVLRVARTAAEGLAAAVETNPGVVLLDLHLPDSQSVRELLKSFCLNRPWKVVVLSAETRPVFVRAAFNAGVKAFASKLDSPQEVMQFIINVADSAENLVSRYIVDEKSVLTEAQQHIVSLMGQGLKYAEIAEIRHTSVLTVRKQCEQLLEKLDMKTREQLIAWAVEHGYSDV